MISTSSAFASGNLNQNKVPVYAFEITGYHYIFSNGTIPDRSQAMPWIVGIDDLQITVNDLDGGADLADLVVHIQDRGVAITADFPSFTFEGKVVQLKAGWGHIPVSGIPVADMAYTDFAVLFTGKIDSVESENLNNDYCFSCPDIRTELSQVIYGTADDSFPTDSNHLRTLLGHPLDILVSLLEDEVGLDASVIDVAKITDYRDGIYSGVMMQFAIDSPPVAKDFIENEIMKPMGAYLWTNNLGQISVNFFYPLDIAPVFSFDRDSLLDIPTAGQADLINQVSTRFDADSGGTFQAESVQQDADSVAKFGLYGSQVIESKGLRSGLNGFFFSSFTAFLLFLHYSDKQLMHGDNGKNSASDPINAVWSAALLDPGDLVTMTHPQIPDRVTGTMGITDKTYVVMDRIWQFFPGNVQYKLLAIDLTKFQSYLITSRGSGSVAMAIDPATPLYVNEDVTITGTGSSFDGGPFTIISKVPVRLMRVLVGYLVYWNQSGFAATCGSGTATWFAGSWNFSALTRTVSGSVGDYTSASPSDKAAYMFLCNDSDQYSNGDAGHTLA